MGKYNRAATTINQQIDILFSRDLNIVNSPETAQKIENIGYFKFKGYCVPFYDSKDHFRPNTSFDDIYDSYMFDQKLHMLLLSLIMRVETQIKSKLGSYIALKYGPLAYIDDDFFKSTEYRTDFLSKIKDDENQANTRNELYAKHYQEVYDDTFPIWVAFEMCSLGTLSKFFSDMKTVDQKEFSRTTFNNPNNNRVENWLHYLTLVRNCCAHNSRTFSRRYSTHPTFRSSDIRFCPNLRENTTFPILYILKELCSSSNYFSSCMFDLKHYSEAYPSANLVNWGFPDNWFEFLD
ncbi:Abortive infection system protein AbiD/AbiF-like protein [Lactiplantibacillus plantarum]|uniref:Abi family protein n=1 Tax=Lactiplantibacillus plantarum TaxID=1590 RepID=UPI0004DD069D|nr:Abi family protein [Lactiplantibacillus plantarum]KEZ15213.1 Abortive infection system protein AbiD/AbiF-like protein [Lactiplantibacillus plantarum]